MDALFIILYIVIAAGVTYVVLRYRRDVRTVKNRPISRAAEHEIKIWPTAWQCSCGEDNGPAAIGTALLEQQVAFHTLGANTVRVVDYRAQA